MVRAGTGLPFMQCGAAWLVFEGDGRWHTARLQAGGLAGGLVVLVVVCSVRRRSARLNCLQKTIADWRRLAPTSWRPVRYVTETTTTTIDCMAVQRGSLAPHTPTRRPARPPAAHRRVGWIIRRDNQRRNRFVAGRRRRAVTEE